VNRRRSSPKPGTRIRLIFCNDVYTSILPGECGTVEDVDDVGTVHVRWDKGPSLGLVPDEDEWEEFRG